MKSLVRWQPFQELNALQRHMNRMFDTFFGKTTSLMPLEESLSGWESVRRWTSTKMTIS